MIVELDHTKNLPSSWVLGMKSCRKCSSVGKYGIDNKLLEISEVSYVSGECEVKREENPIMNRK